MNLAELTVYDTDFEEKETFQDITTIIDSGNNVILLMLSGQIIILNKFRYDINTPVWRNKDVNFNKSV